MIQDRSSELIDPFIEKFDLSYDSSGMLANLTFAVKDLIDIKNHITGCGNPLWKKEHLPATSHAICIDKLLHAGARCTGKTICDEFAFSLYGKNFFYGTPLNPRAPEHIPGGSSSGSASAVAGGMVDFALGTDTAGSVRVPASNCGVFGMRPSHGRCSLSGVITCSPTFDTVGIFSKSLKVLDAVAKVLLDTVPDNRPFNKIYLITEAFSLCDASVLHTLEAPIAELKKNHPGQIIEASLNEILGLSDGFQACFECHGLIKNIEAWDSFGSWLRQNPYSVSPKIKDNFDYIASLNRKDLADKICLREKLRNKLNRFLEQGNLLCFPTAAGLPPLISASSEELKEKKYSRRTLMIASIACMGDLPEITVPCSDGIPMGLSFAAAYRNDAFLIQAVSQLRRNALGPIFEPFLKS
jgi:amidase